MAITDGQTWGACEQSTRAATDPDTTSTSTTTTTGAERKGNLLEQLADATGVELGPIGMSIGAKGASVDQVRESAAVARSHRAGARSRRVDDDGLWVVVGLHGRQAAYSSDYMRAGRERTHPAAADPRRVVVEVRGVRH